jgi:CheY-like chemotaxis protein
MPYGSILIVDDVETNLYVAEAFLKPYELRTETAMSGFEAIDKIESGKSYSLILMDHMMPKMDGIETTQRLRKMGFTNPIIALTANALVGQEEVFLSSGFDGFISKPIDIHHLDRVLNKMVRDRQPPEVIEAARRSADKPIILAIDDNPVELKNINAMLKAQYKVSSLPSPGRLKDLLGTVKPDLFLLNCLMLEMGADELIAIIRSAEDHKETPIILMAAESVTDMPERVKTLEASDYIIKPIKEVELLDKIGLHVRR